MSVYRLGDAISDMGCGVSNQLVSNLLGGAVLLAAYEALFTHADQQRAISGLFCSSTAPASRQTFERALRRLQGRPA